MITLTPAAARQINSVLDDNDAEDLALRVAARLGDDGAIEYALGLDQPREGDLAIDEKGVPLLIGVASHALLAGARIDFVEYEPGDFRFIFVAADSLANSDSLRVPTGVCGSGACSKCGPGA